MLKRTDTEKFRGRDIKVAIVASCDLSKTQGTNVRTKSIFSSLNQYFNATMIGLSSSIPDESLPRIRVTAPSFRGFLRLPFWLVRLAETFSKCRFDVVYSSDDWFGFIVYFLLRRALKHKIVMDAHGILSEEMRNLGKPAILVAFTRLWERFVVKHSDAVIAPSRRIINFYREYAERSELIPVFVDTELYKRDVDVGEKLRKRHDLRGKVVGLIGPFDSMWNESSLAFLYRNLDSFDNRIVFAVIGRCPLRIDSKKVFYTGYVDDYVGFLSCLDGVLVPRMVWNSGTCNKIIESMSCSLAVFTTPGGAVGLDYVENGRSLLVFSEDQLAEKLNTLIFDDDLIGRLGANAREVVEEHYSQAVNVRKLVDIVRPRFG